MAGTAGGGIGGAGSSSGLAGAQMGMDFLTTLIGLTTPQVQNASGTSTSNTKTTSESSLFGDADFEQLRMFMSAMLGGQQDFSKKAAIADTQNLMNGAIRALKEQALPALFSQQTQAGAYNSTGTQQLANDLTARTAEQVASLQLDAINNYSQNNQNQLQTILEAFNVLKGGRSTSSSEVDQESETTSTTKTGSDGGILSNLIGGLF